MANKKTSTKQTKSPKKSKPGEVEIGGMTFTEYSPTQWIKDNKDIMLRGLAEAFADGDKEAIQDIMGALVRVQNISQVTKKAKISRTLIYDAINHKMNPSLKTLCQIMKSFG